MLYQLRQSILAFLKKEEGLASMEYALLLGLAVVAGLTVFQWSLKENKVPQTALMKSTIANSSMSR